MRRRPRRAIVVALLASATALVSGATLTVAVSTAAAATAHRAVVVVDFGDGHTHVAPISFTSSSINGLTALDLAGYTPVVRAFAGNGGAVCAITDSHGTVLGCPADSTCFTCAAPDYWRTTEPRPARGTTPTRRPVRVPRQ